MKANEFEATSEFEHFKDAMRHILSVSKEELDKRVRAAQLESSRKGNPNAPGRKAKRRKKRAQAT